MASYARGRHELKFGLLTIFSAVVFIVMFALLTDRGLSRQGGTIHVALPSAEKLRKGDQLLYRGVPVGTVRSVGFAPEAGVVVKARLTQAVPLTRDATASLVAVGFFGGQAVELRPGSPAEPRLARRDTIWGAIEPSFIDRFETLGSQAERLLADSTIALLRTLLHNGGEAAAGMQEVSAVTSALLRQQAIHLGEVTARTAAIAGNIERATAGDEMARSLANLEQATARLARVGDNMDDATAALASALAKLDAGQGTMGRLINDPALYDRLFAAAGTLDELMTDVKANPRRYVNLKIF